MTPIEFMNFSVEIQSKVMMKFNKWDSNKVINSKLNAQTIVSEMKKKFGEIKNILKIQIYVVQLFMLEQLVLKEGNSKLN